MRTPEDADDAMLQDAPRRQRHRYAKGAQWTRYARPESFGVKCQAL